jgi:hypothetical protein
MITHITHEWNFVSTIPLIVVQRDEQEIIHHEAVFQMRVVPFGVIEKPIFFPLARNV